MQRYFVNKERFLADEVTIVGDDVKHIQRVLRMDVGENIICSNNDTRVAVCKITAISSEEVKASIQEELQISNELPVQVTIAQGLPKGDKLDYIIQKGTELGATRFIPLSLSRSIVKWDENKEGKKVGRLEKIAKEAAEQSHRSRIPEVERSTSLMEMIKNSANYDHKIFAYEESAKIGQHEGLSDVLNNIKTGESLLVIIGPEGGLSKEEVELLENNGFIRTSFGPRILRTETAPLYLLSAVSYHLELLR